MKRFLFQIIIIAIFPLNSLLFSQNIQGSGVIKQEKRNVSGVQYIVNDSPAKVIVKVGNKEEVIVEGDDNLINIINTYVKNKSLTISTSDVNFISKQSMTVYITAKDLLGLKVKSSGDIITSGRINSPKMTVIVDGSGDIKIANILSDLLTLAVMGSGDVKISGRTENLEAEISSSGDIDAQLLNANLSNILIKGSGDCSINTSKQTMIKITGSGDVKLYGKPPIVKQYITGSGVIRVY